MAINNNLQMGDLTIGVSKAGMDSYIENLKLEIITNTIQKMDNIQAIEAAINKGWQGESRDKFLTLFKKQRDLIKEDLKKEYKDLEFRLQELEASYYKQDKEMLDI